MSDLQIKIITPTGMFGSRGDEGLITTAMRIIGVGFGEDGDWSAKYGCNAETVMFAMRTFYWGDCDCDSDERKEAWDAVNQHAPECWQSERDVLWNRYDEKVGWEKIEKATFGDDTDDFLRGFDNEESAGPIPGMMLVSSQPRTDAAMKSWNRANDKREKAHARIVAELYDKFGLPRQPYQWYCSCGYDELRMKADIGHRDTCSLELPNFLYKPTGFALTWYKYIGRDMEVAHEAPLPADFMERIFAAHPKGVTLGQAIAETARQEERTAASFAEMFAQFGVQTSP